MARNKALIASSSSDSDEDDNLNLAKLKRHVQSKTNTDTATPKAKEDKRKKLVSSSGEASSEDSDKDKSEDEEKEHLPQNFVSDTSNSASDEVVNEDSSGEAFEPPIKRPQKARKPPPANSKLPKSQDKRSSKKVKEESKSEPRKKKSKRRAAPISDVSDVSSNSAQENDSDRHSNTATPVKKNVKTPFGKSDRAHVVESASDESSDQDTESLGKVVPGKKARSKRAARVKKPRHSAANDDDISKGKSQNEADVDKAQSSSPAKVSEEPKFKPAPISSSGDSSDGEGVGDLHIQLEEESDDQQRSSDEESEKTSPAIGAVSKDHGERQSDQSDHEDISGDRAMLKTNKNKATGQAVTPTEETANGGATNIMDDKQSDSSSSSDVSIIDLTPVKKPAETEPHKSTNKSLPAAESKSKKKSPLEPEMRKLAKLKQCVTVAGLHCAYKRLFENLTSDRQRIKKLKEFFVEKGLEGPLTFERCKQFRVKREQMKELAELDASNILTEGRLRTRNKNKSFHQEMIAASRNEDTESDSRSSDGSRAGDCKKLFSRLQDIVDSSDSE